MQRVANPFLAFLFFISCNSVTKILVPEIKMKTKMNSYNPIIIKNLVLDSVFPNKKDLKLTINTTENGEKVTTVFTNFPKPIVSRYKFIKGFEKGTLDFQSIKKNGVPKPKRRTQRIVNKKMDERSLLIFNSWL